MEFELENTNDTLINTSAPVAIDQPIFDYSIILTKHSLEYKPVNYYFQIGEITQVQGWILHLSVIKSQIADLLNVIIPELVNNDTPFKIVQNKELARLLLDGSLGYFKVGKVVSIYPKDETVALLLANKFISLTKGFKGPAILTDKHLGSVVYARYGAFNPIQISDEAGKQENFIHDTTGNLITDSYTIPYQIQDGLTWPFSSLVDLTPPTFKKILNRIYKPISFLKIDAKGNVIKAIYLRKLFLLNWCVIKQGKKNMWSDEFGRDIHDRLVWQKELHISLAKKIPMPKFIDLFIEDGDTFLVMEYIKGQSLLDRISINNSNCYSWSELPVGLKLILLDYLLEVINIIQKLHRNGFIHRDITPVNFIITNRNKIYLVDNELAYSLTLKRPDPPFVFGTPGFISPEQEINKIPTIKEDIFGLGATMMLLITGISPNVLKTGIVDDLNNRLYTLTQSNTISKVISSCLLSNPDLRPDLEHIKSSIKLHKDEIHVNMQFAETELKQRSNSNADFKNVIQDGLTGMITSPMMIMGGVWQSKVINPNELPGEEKFEFTKSGSLFNGVAGILYFLGRTKKLGFNIDVCQNAYNSGWEYLKCEYLKPTHNQAAGLYGGSAGIALAIVSGIEAGLLNGDSENRGYILQCFHLKPSTQDIANGVAGQAIALLQCRDYLEKDLLQQLLQRNIKSLIYAMEKIKYQAGIKGKLATDSFSYGNLGIIWLLLEVAHNLKDAYAKDAAAEALKNLNRFFSYTINYLKKNGCRKIFNERSLIGDNVFGMLLILINAYKTFQDPLYKKLFKESLKYFPNHIAHDNLNQYNGLAGLGEIYLEAYRIFGDELWLERANWIANFFSHTSKRNKSNSCYWLSNNYTLPTADLMTGNSGILHFLIRYMAPDKIGYRVLQ